ncbi:hypothetical protein SF1_18880 [Sphingobacterium faecium NBRC 15299]|nr:hypothetical protein SF1_18880 [Sphingobacterium faecium NBRC 15299]
MEIGDEFEGNDMEDILAFFYWLEEIGFGKFCNEKEWTFWSMHAGEMYKEWDSPFYFNNAIIDYNENLKAEIFRFIHAIGLRGTSTLQVRFFNIYTIEKIEELLNYIVSLKAFYGLSVVIDANCFGGNSNYLQENFIEKYSILNEIVIFNAKNDDHTFVEKNKVNIIQIARSINVKNCGAIQQFYFNLEIDHFTESMNHNTCLNRKIAVDTLGNIKNCPSMIQSYGNIKDTNLEKAITHPDFEKFWHIKKDEISKCKDCEFRYVCTDCRAYLDNPTDIYSAPLKCGYDPYNAQWEDWSTNPLKQNAIEYYQF